MNNNQSMTIIAAIFISVVGADTFIIQPGIVQGLVSQYGFTEQQAGAIASAEMWGLATTTVLLTFLAKRLNWRHALYAALAVNIAGSLASIYADTALTFGVLRFIAGLGSGVMVSLSFTMIGLTDKPDRNFGYLIMWVLTYGAIGMLLIPTALARVGMDGIIVFLAAFAALALPLVRFLPQSGEEQAQVNEDAIDLAPQLKLMAVAAMFCYFLAQGVVWAYLFLIGIAGGVSEQEVANGLTASQILGIAGALLAALLGSRFGRIKPLTLGIIAGIVPLTFLFGAMGALVYGVAVCVYNFAWNWTHPYLLASMASFDQQGRVVVNAVAAQILGLALGPLLAARIITEGVYDNALWAGMALFALSLCLVIPPVVSHRRRIA